MNTKYAKMTGLIALMIFIWAGSAFAYTLKMETTDSSGNDKTSFARGEPLYLNILVDDAKDIAGCTFTLNYSSAILTPPSTDGEGVSADITSTTFPFKYATTDTHRANSSTAGKILFSGAAINETTGGGKYAVSTPDVPLFRVKFTVKTDAAVGTGYTFSIVQTVLTNTNAGWNGEGAPVLVGAVDKNTLPAYNNLNCTTNPGNCAFPVLLETVNVTSPGFEIIESNTPAVTVPQTYSSGMNLVPFSPQGSGITKASEWDASIVLNNPGITVKSIKGWDPVLQKWMSAYVHIGSVKTGDFLLVSGRAYFIELVNGGGTLSISGFDYESVELYPKLNLFSVPYGRQDTIIKASDLDADIVARTGLTVKSIKGFDPVTKKWLTAYVHIGTVKTGDFNIDHDSMGLFVEIVGGPATYYPYQ